MTRSWSAGRRREWSRMEKTAWRDLGQHMLLVILSIRLSGASHTWGCIETVSGAVEG